MCVCTHDAEQLWKYRLKTYERKGTKFSKGCLLELDLVV